MEALQGDDYPLVCSGKQKNACSGVYTVQELVNIHEGGNSAQVAVLRPNLLCHVDSLIDRYGNEGCVLTGKSYHRCVISPKIFPIMHQLLLTVPHDTTDASWDDKVTKLLRDFAGDQGKLQLCAKM